MPRPRAHPRRDALNICFAENPQAAWAMKISISHFRKACMPTCMIRVYLVDATTKQTHVAFINLNVRINLDERIRLACLLAFANSATRGRRRLPLKSATRRRLPLKSHMSRLTFDWRYLLLRRLNCNALFGLGQTWAC